jgi:hypothetical protein
MDMRAILLGVMQSRCNDLKRQMGKDDLFFLAERSCEAVNALATFGEVAGLLAAGEAAEIHAGVGTLVYGEGYAAGYFGAAS